MSSPENDAGGDLLGSRTPRDVELDRLAGYPDIPYEKGREGGVLLSDEIAYYATRYRMIDPFIPANLKPAGYELTVGKVYAMNGEYGDLTDGQTIVIEPFAVVVIQTLETLNLPNFLIARWNVRTRWAYQGLLWVGAAQVDAGFRGYLACPLYNLSDTDVSIKFKEAIAVIDFVTTTPPNNYSKPYEWKTRSRVTFREYEPHKLRSAIVTRVTTELDRTKILVDELRENFQQSEQRTRDAVNTETTALQARVDNFTSTTFTVIAVLFAALGLAAARSIESSFWSSTIWLSAIAMWFAMRAYVLTRSRLQFLSQTSDGNRRPTWDLTRVPLWIEVVAGIVLSAVLLGSNYVESKSTTNSLQQLRSESTQAHTEIQALQGVINGNNAELQKLQIENEALRSRLDSIEKPKQPPR